MKYDKINKVSVDGNGNLVLQDIKGDTINITFNDTKEFKELLIQASDELQEKMLKLFSEHKDSINLILKDIFNDFHKLPIIIIEKKNELIKRVKELSSEFKKLSEAYENFWVNSTPCLAGDCFKSEELRKIIEAIQSGNCVLFIGQEISVDNNNISLHEKFNLILHNHFISESKEIKYLKTEGLFTPQIVSENFAFELYYSDTANKTRPYISTKFHEDNSIVTRLLTKLAHIPFSLVISITPDDTMEQIYKNLDIIKKANYFKTTSGKDIELEKPTKDKPILYYLIGEPDGKFKNYIYEHRQLYDYIKKIQQFKLPEAIREKLADAKYLLFIGFDFDKWYNQLILYFMNLHHPMGSNPVVQSIMRTESNGNIEDKISLTKIDLDILFKNILQGNKILNDSLQRIIDEYDNNLQIIIDRSQKCVYFSNKHLYKPDELEILVKEQFNVSFINRDYEEFIDTLIYHTKSIDGSLFRNHSESFISLKEKIIDDQIKKLSLNIFDAGRGDLLIEFENVLTLIEKQTKKLLTQYS